MKNFIADNWIVIIGVLLAIIVGIVVALIVMDRRDKKLIAEYKASLKSSKAEPTPVEDRAEEIEGVEPVAEEVEEPVVEAKEEPVKKTPAKTTSKPAAKTTTTKKAPAKSTAKKTTGTKTTKKSK